MTQQFFSVSVRQCFNLP